MDNYSEDREVQETWEKEHHLLGKKTNHTWVTDPRHLGMLLARYKFVAKMLDGYEHVLEVGCGDGWKSRVVAQSVQHLEGIDVDKAAIAEANKWGWIEARWHDFLQMPTGKKYDAIYCLDVLEHIPQEQESLFLKNVIKSFYRHGVFICGMPSAESQTYASPMATRHHVNCKSHADFRHFLRRHFQHVFVFGMNDEVLHTGYGPMCQYLLGVCCEP